MRKSDVYYPLYVLKEGVFIKKIYKTALTVILILTFLFTGAVWASSVIEGMRIEGNRHIKSEEIHKVIKSIVGELLSEQKVREDMQAIYDMGFFSYLSVFQEKGTDGGVILIFQVEENERISEISFEGVSSKEIKNIKKLLTFKEGDLYNSIGVKETKDKIIQFYHEKGFFSASVSILPKGREEGEWEVVISVQKGEKVRVKRVEIKGNSVFSDSRLRSLMKTRFGRFFNEETLTGDLEKIVDFYQNYGYYFAHFKPSNFEFSEEKSVKWVTIFLDMVEGEKFFVSGVEIEGENKILSNSEILSQFKPAEGELLVPNYIRDSINLFQDKYGEKGYIYIRIKPDLIFDRERSMVNILLQIEEGPQVRVGQVRIEGNELSRDRVFKHTFALKEGDIFDIKKAREGWRRLYNLGFFEEVEVEPIPASFDTVDLLIRVKETGKKGEFYVGGGYNTTSGFQGDIQFFRDNLWGEGKKIGIEWQFGKKRDEYNIAYLDRWWGGTPIRLEPRIYKKRDRYNNIDEDYEKESTGVELRVGKPVWEFSHIYITSKDERIKLTDVGEKGMLEGMEEGKKTLHSLEFILDRDTRVRDEAFNPFQGSYSYISTETTGGPILAGDLTFTRYGGEWRGYLRKGTFWKSLIIAYRLRARFGENLPPYEKFRAGGMETLRGYSQNEFRGEKLLLGNLELRLPLSKDFLGSLFLDVGKIYDKDYSIVKSGWGFGMRIRTIIGFIRLDYGMGEEGGQFYFGMGEGF